MAKRLQRVLHLICWMILGVAAVSTAQAQDRRVALVIGNSAYQSVAPLANPRNDAADLTEALTLAGFEVIEGLDLTRNEMTSTIREFVDQLDGASTGLFFYAGHGLQVDGRNYMIPTDMVLRSEADLQLQAIDMNLVLAHMERDPRVNIIMLDACRDNPFAQSMTRSLARGLAPMETRSVGSLIVYSTQPGAVADDGVGRVLILLVELGPGVKARIFDALHKPARGTQYACERPAHDLQKARGIARTRAHQQEVIVVGRNAFENPKQPRVHFA